MSWEEAALVIPHVRRGGTEGVPVLIKGGTSLLSAFGLGIHSVSLVLMRWCLLMLPCSAK